MVCKYDEEVPPHLIEAAEQRLHLHPSATEAEHISVLMASGASEFAVREALIRASYNLKNKNRPVD